MPDVERWGKGELLINRHEVSVMSSPSNTAPLVNNRMLYADSAKRVRVLGVLMMIKAFVVCVGMYVFMCIKAQS